MLENNSISEKESIAEPSKFMSLLNEVLDKHKHPQDSFEIAALLESMGWNDTRASKEFGVQDIFELADQIWDAMQEKVSYHPFSKAKKSNLFLGIINMIRSFLRGLIFAFPMAISVAAMLNLKFSLWSYQYLSLDQATGIAIGTILSFMIVGGFTQAIARRGFLYIIQGYYNLARKSTFLFIWIGFGLCVVVSLLLFVLNFIFNFFPYNMIVLIVVFFFFLTSIWLSVTVMYILKKEIVFTGLIIFGIFLIYVLFVLFHIPIIISQLISLCIVSICSIFLVIYFFMKAEKKGEKGIALKLPRFSITLYSVWPYFAYGFLYFTFLFIDRINAWSRNEEIMPYLIWFRGQYELGLDFALLTIIIPMGVSEVIINKLMVDIEYSQKEYLARDSGKLYGKFLRTYRWMSFFILVTSIVSSFLIYKLIFWYNNISIQINHEDMLNNNVTLFVLFWGIVSYIILAFCLMNAVILFALSQPIMILKAILLSLFVDVTVGFLLSRWVAYQYAVFGLFVGSILFFILSTRSVRKVLKNLDYYLYAAS
ncbi:hypothetical protein [Ectobacillus polymachus]|uniref:hypothetical protein n=1 Tax=Ectobacillus polymachus TaxID=1508806 RepID=UPI003A86E80B